MSSLINEMVPAEGHKLTQAADVDIKERIIASRLCLGKNDSRENWKEITEEEAAQYEAEKQAAIEAEMQAAHAAPEMDGGDE